MNIDLVQLALRIQSFKFSPFVGPQKLHGKTIPLLVRHPATQLLQSEITYYVSSGMLNSTQLVHHSLGWARERNMQNNTKQITFIMYLVSTAIDNIWSTEIICLEPGRLIRCLTDVKLISRAALINKSWSQQFISR